ncbi:small kinetochore-associated protein [Onychostruthus taczanowskii]|uniref:small kinetochore-associated protein n=1 Tax=Onychostruthus taczanowskii TaxID=356909 RepID=UPI001B80C4D7|nr:small kinetochore-associated protein [Onychostruthus taczanowskii]
MDGQLSRIPVHSRLHRPEPSAELQINFPSKRKCVSKTSEPELSVVPSLHFASNVPADSVFKPANQGMPKFEKKVEPVSKKAVAKRPLSRYQLEAELKNKNQLVETLKQQLARREGSLKVKELKKENENLVHEVEKLKKIQETCMTILESRNINPGSHIEEDKEMRACREKTTTLTKKATEELTLFSHRAAKEKEMLETAMAKWKSAQEENQNALEKYSDFQAEIKEWKTMLEALEKLLAM